MEKKLRTWLIEPVAAPEDPRWQGRLIWRRLVVREASEAFARLAAEHYALSFVGRPTGPGNESPSPVAGPMDVKLYGATELTDKDALASGQAEKKGVVLAEMLAQEPAR